MIQSFINKIASPGKDINPFCVDAIIISIGKLSKFIEQLPKLLIQSTIIFAKEFF